MFFNQKVLNSVLQENKQTNKQKIQLKKNQKEKEEKVLNYKPIFLRSKDVLSSVVIFNLE